jgi:diguanylate cyclase (GGDEF)-like protein/PAS domain S-box-containing protein
MTFRLRLWPAIAALIAGGLVFAGTSLLNRYEDDTYRANLRGEAERSAQELAARLEGALNQPLIGILQAEALARFDPKTSAERFAELGASALRTGPEVIGRGLAPGGIVRVFSPLEGNERFLGWNITALPQARQALEQGGRQDLILLGPFDLAADLRALLWVRPIWLNSAYWGASVVLIDFTRLMERAGAWKVQADYRLALARMGGDGRLDYLLRDADFMPDAAIFAPIAHAAGQWIIALSPKSPLAGDRPLSWLYRLLGGAGSLFAAGAVLLAVHLYLGLRSSHDELALQGARLQASENQLKSLLEASPAALTVATESGQILFSNQKSRELLGLRQCEEIQGLPATDFYFDPSDRQRMLSQTDEMGNVDESEVRLKSRDGRTFWAILSARRIAFEGERSLLFSIQDISERKMLEDELFRLAATDMLTGISNRRRLLEIAEKELLRAERFQHGFSILILDLDHFKMINDEFGHAVGDEALKAVARHCSMALRTIDTFGRLGGEEFAALLPETEAPMALQVAERLRKAVELIDLSRQGQRISLTVSIGVTSAQPGERILNALIERADKALYQAKAEGRNRVIQAQIPLPVQDFDI